MRRPRTLLLLLLFFCWVEARALGWIVFPKTSGSYLLYAALDQMWVHYATCVLTVALAATAAGYLWRPKAGWFEATMLALSVFGVSGLAGMWYTLQHVDAARDAYAASRVARGLPVEPERLAKIFSAEALWFGALVMTAFYVLLAAMAFRRREYVHSAETDSPSVDPLA